LQLSLFVGQTYEEQKTVERTISAEHAQEVVETLKANGFIDDDGKITREVKPADLPLPQVPEAIRAVVINTIEKAEPVAVESLSGKVYTETVTEEKTISYEDATALMTHLEKQNLITKDGKIKDTMKAQLAAGTLDLGARFTQAAQRAIVQTIERADNRPPIRDASREVTVHLKNRRFYHRSLWNYGIGSSKRPHTG